jgi:NADH:ubiquinone reductase (non-electrogenic)
MATPTVQRIVIVGSGWAGLTLSRKLDDKKSTITIISPQATCPYTPLLASTACGLFHSSLAEEPIRQKNRAVKYVQATVTDVDFKRKACTCNPAFSALSDVAFEVEYDILVLAPGCTNQTFGIPGVAENGLFVRNVADAIAVQHKMHEILEIASLPNMTQRQQQDVLHVVVVGGGPTGVEITAELYDLFSHDLSKLYPDLKGKFTISIHDVASNILSVFDASLSKYALDSFERRHVSIKTDSHITSVDKDFITTKEDGNIPYGLLIWATGNKAVPLVERLPVLRSSRLPRIQTDGYLRVFNIDETVIDSVFALGDAADIKGGELPTTAEVACQKGEYLAEVLNKRSTDDVVPFAYRQKAIVAYLGQHDGVIGGQKDWEGSNAWIAWRSKNLTWTRSWRTKIAIVFEWALNFGFGKDIVMR